MNPFPAILFVSLGLCTEIQMECHMGFVCVRKRVMIQQTDLTRKNMTSPSVASSLWQMMFCKYPAWSHDHTLTVNQGSLEGLWIVVEVQLHDIAINIRNRQRNLLATLPHMSLAVLHWKICPHKQDTRNLIISV